MIDAHAHLDLYEDQELPEVLEEITRQRIFTISVSMDPASYRRNLEITRRTGLVLPAFGVHPWNAPEIDFFTKPLNCLQIFFKQIRYPGIYKMALSQ